MPPKKRPSALTNDYESDNGFVEDAPKSKKAKTSLNKSKISNKEENTGVGGSTLDDDGQVFWELSGKRRIGVQEFKGNTMVNIREYYEKDGAMLPGKKGISLPIDQFNTLINILPHLEKVLVEKGEKIGRPDYDAVGSEPAEADKEEEEEEEEEEESETKVKKNFEETSDDD